MIKLPVLPAYAKKIKTNEMLKDVSVQGMLLVMSLLMSSVSFAGGLSPFSIGFISAVSTSYFMACAVGSAAHLLRGAEHVCVLA